MHTRVSKDSVMQEIPGIRELSAFIIANQTDLGDVATVWKSCDLVEFLHVICLIGREISECNSVPSTHNQTTPCMYQY